MDTAALIFPHQLFKQNPVLKHCKDVWLVEDDLFFGDQRYPQKFHQQKLVLHIASLSNYRTRLERRKLQLHYVSYAKGGTLRKALEQIKKSGYKTCRVVEVVDFILEKRLKRHCRELGLELIWMDSPGFLNTKSENSEYRESKSRWFMADFYKWQRRRLDILMQGESPRGEQWSFDKENRKKVPKSMLGNIPPLRLARSTQAHKDAIARVQKEFPDNPGSIDEIYYPCSHEAAETWLQDFCEYRLSQFGPYEDAIVAEEHWLFHSVLTPMLNIGLLTPAQVVEAALDFASHNKVELASLEGFIRQIIGWREFMRATYEDLGTRMRTANAWQHQHDIPSSFYTGETGITPVDDVIKKLLRTGYCHHIERLMVLGGFFFLCEFSPDDVYRWFMDMFIDSYDWVMVPNVYAMSQNADGGSITTKPYFSGSNYIKKMSHYKHEAWADTWDALYWRWIIKNKSSLASNPRWAMMVSQVKKMDKAKYRRHQNKGNEFLRQF